MPFLLRFKFHQIIDPIDTFVFRLAPGARENTAQLGDTSNNRSYSEPRFHAQAMFSPNVKLNNILQKLLIRTGYHTNLKTTMAEAPAAMLEN